MKPGSGGNGHSRSPSVRLEQGERGQWLQPKIKRVGLFAAIGSPDRLDGVVGVVDSHGNHAEGHALSIVAVIMFGDGTGGGIGDNHDFKACLDQRAHVRFRAKVRGHAA